MLQLLTHQRVVAPHPSEQIDLILEANDSHGALYLSGLEGAMNHQQLRRRNITAVLTVGSDIADTRFGPNMKHKIIQVLDYPDQNISCHFSEAINYIETALLAKQNVLIHCYIGVSRSVTICIAYLMKIKRFTLNHAFRHIKAVRPLIEPNEGFLLQLYNYYQSIKQPVVSCQSLQPSPNNQRFRRVRSSAFTPIPKTNELQTIPGKGHPNRQVLLCKK